MRLRQYLGNADRRAAGQNERGELRKTQEMPPCALYLYFRLFFKQLHVAT
jgi:hypothetical protein